MKRPATRAEREQQATPNHTPAHQLALEQPPYAPDFVEWLAYEFARTPPAEVPALLARYFPAPDQVDRDYLAALLTQMDQARHCEREVGCGVDFIFWGIEYAAPSVAAARQWLALPRAVPDA